MGERSRRATVLRFSSDRSFVRNIRLTFLWEIAEKTVNAAHQAMTKHIIAGDYALSNQQMKLFHCSTISLLTADACYPPAVSPIFTVFYAP